MVHISWIKQLEFPIFLVVALVALKFASRLHPFRGFTESWLNVVIASATILVGFSIPILFPAPQRWIALPVVAALVVLTLIYQAKTREITRAAFIARLSFLLLILLGAAAVTASSGVSIALLAFVAILVGFAFVVASEAKTRTSADS